MIIRTYTDNEELINEHKLSDKDNYQEFYNMLYVNILRKFDDKHVIKLCIDLLSRSSIDSQIIKEIKEHLDYLEIAEMRKYITNKLNELEK